MEISKIDGANGSLVMARVQCQGGTLTATKNNKTNIVSVVFSDEWGDDRFADPKQFGKAYATVKDAVMDV